MRNTISARLFNTLQKGKEQLGTEALRKISCFVESQRTAEGAFKDKSGKADLYYTVFGWMLSYVLGVRMDAAKMNAYLMQQHVESLDLIHYAAYLRCKMISRLVKGGKSGLLLWALFSTGSKALDKNRNLPHNDPQSPYTQFIRLSLQEDSGWRIKEKKKITDSLAGYHLPDGGYMNTTGGLTATTNATVAALSVVGQLTGYKGNEDVLFLRDRQHATGGFSAAAASPVPDMLSTATSLFILSCYGIAPKYPVRDFIEAHWLDSGGFAATLLEEQSDVEYTFYGLLALGSI
ncbi:prenyltransferase/squalene oxidase repeat-containing protein [Bacteroides sp. UBA939]|uniref:prenyltransferase/squalene oxidase repeat-containing protein n=1 Tax=Bacteroides sp. UBA939 TaxID=1946092 RepID=UPI0025C22B74|nr:prenyltransferase/squalene oxidase repeat-containing protein [Bacteroides sp. UBA939]